MGRAVLPLALLSGLVALAMRPLAEFPILTQAYVNELGSGGENGPSWNVLVPLMTLLAVLAAGWIIGHREWQRHEDSYRRRA